MNHCPHGGKNNVGFLVLLNKLLILCLVVYSFSRCIEKPHFQQQVGLANLGFSIEHSERILPEFIGKNELYDPWVIDASPDGKTLAFVAGNIGLVTYDLINKNPIWIDPAGYRSKWVSGKQRGLVWISNQQFFVLTREQVGLFQRDSKIPLWINTAKVSFFHDLFSSQGQIFFIEEGVGLVQFDPTERNLQVHPIESNLNIRGKLKDGLLLSRTDYQSSTRVTTWFQWKESNHQLEIIAPDSLPSDAVRFSGNMITPTIRTNDEVCLLFDRNFCIFNIDLQIKESLNIQLKKKYSVTAIRLVDDEYLFVGYGKLHTMRISNPGVQLYEIRTGLLIEDVPTAGPVSFFIPVVTHTGKRVLTIERQGPQHQSIRLLK